MHFVLFISIFLYVFKGSHQMDTLKMIRGECATDTTNRRTSTGNIVIDEVNPQGKFIVLENISYGPYSEDVDMDGWKLKRTVDFERDYTYIIHNFELKAGQKVKIFARGSESEAGFEDLVFEEEDSWGAGSDATTSLVNDKDEEEATHVQETLCK